MAAGRYAPSPTGDLHVGNAFAAVLTWARARNTGARCFLRIEDLDTPRVVPGAAARIVEDCATLGLPFDPFVPGPGDDDAVDGGVVWQSRRTRAYEEALRRLIDADLIFACRCSRKDLQRAASAPHVGDEGPVYPGTCRDRGLPLDAPDVALRVRVDRLVDRWGAGVVVVEDAWQGCFVQDVVRDVGDFVVRRKDGLFAYQLAVVVDDLWQGITEVVRGQDLLASAPRQVLLHRALGNDAPPSFAHLPLLVDEEGHRLSKRSAQAPELLRTALSRVSVARLLGHFAALLGLADDGEELDAETFSRLPLDGALRRPAVSWRPP